MAKWIVQGEDGYPIGYSFGESHEEAFYNFGNGSLLLSDIHAEFTKLPEGLNIEMHKPVTVYIYGKAVVLTVDTIKATLQHYAENERACATGALTGDFIVNDVDRYVKDREQQAEQYERQIEEGMDERMSLAFVQQAYYIQSGESVPMLSK